MIVTNHTINTTVSRKCLRLLLMVVVAMMSCVAWAENNTMHINGELYEMYKQAFKQRTRQEGLRLAWRMYGQAVLKDDRKAQCLALTLPMAYYFYVQSDKEFYRAADRLQTEALRLGEEEYYYNAMSNKVNYMLNNRDMSQARSCIYEMGSIAKKNNSKYGIYSFVMSMAVLCQASSEISTAISYLEQALKIAEDDLPTVNKAEIYNRFTKCYINLYMYDRMYEYGLKAFEASQSVMQSHNAIVTLCYSSYLLGKYKEFVEYYNKYVEFNGQVDPDSHDFDESNIAILKMFHDGDLDRAYIYIMKKHGKEQKKLLAEYYRLRHDYRMQALTERDIYREHICNIDNVFFKNFDDVYSRVFNLRLNFQHQQLSAQHQKLNRERREAALQGANLELANTQLLLKNSSLELARANSESDMLKLSYNRKQLEAERLREKLKLAKAQQETSYAISVLGVMVGFIVIIAIGIYLWTKSKVTAELRETNANLERNHEDLKKAKVKAESADQAKSAFIHNMGDEIRQPLDNIAHIAEQIAKTKGTASKKQMQELIRLMHDNTDELLAIVGNGLKKT